MNILLFIVMIMISFIAVRIGAIALHLTGLEWNLAKFQALSCFTGTGFTTRESELITTDVKRRKIATVLMVFGNAGLVTLIATFANTLRTPSLITIKIPFIHSFIPSYFLPWLNLGIIILVMIVFYKISQNSKFMKKVTDILRVHMKKRTQVEKVSVEELVVATSGYGISRIAISPNSNILNKTLSDSGLRKSDISVLAIERKLKVIPNPKSTEKIFKGDKLICFGKLGQMRSRLNKI